jgi:hypothetical protein
MIGNVRSVRWRPGFLVAGAVAGAAAPSTALAASSEPIHLQYDAANTCPSGADFLDLVHADGGKLTEPRSTEDSRAVSVSIEGSGPFRGRLHVRAPDGAEADRRIEGETCDEVARALAIMLVLAVDMQAPPPPASESPPRVAPTPRDDPEAPTVLLVRPLERWRVGLSASGTIGTGASPGPDPAVAAYVEVAYDGAGALSPSFRVGAETGATWTINEEAQSSPAPLSGLSTGPEATLQHKLARLDACPVRWIAAQPWDADYLSAQPCARVEAGTLDVRSNIGSGNETKRLWLAAGATLRVRWMLFHGAFFEAEGGVLFPLLRDRFFLERPSTDVFVVPAAGGMAGIGFGMFVL